MYDEKNQSLSNKIIYYLFMREICYNVWLREEKGIIVYVYRSAHNTTNKKESHVPYENFKYTRIVNIFSIEIIRRVKEMTEC